MSALPDFAAARAANDAALAESKIGAVTHERVGRAIVRAEARCLVIDARRRKHLKYCRDYKAKLKLARQFVASIAAEGAHVP